jgi:3alpha(or 20beta)-hydroxysteroid dehydrogenase
MSGCLAGQVTRVSGAASGIGAVTGRLFAREGAAVVISDNQDEDGQHLAREFTARWSADLLSL